MNVSIGVFGRWQPQYAAHRIATFPVKVYENQKKPAVRQYARIGLQGSAQLVAKFYEAEALGFICGSRNGITVLDIDTPDESVLAEALSKHGPTPVIVRSGSGNFQAWYRHNGEERSIRPWRDAAPIDVLGGGYVVAPPSKGKQGYYELIQGHLDDLDTLPVLRNLDFGRSRSDYGTIGTKGPISIGSRNKTLFRVCMRQAHQRTNLDDLLSFARHENAQYHPPLLDEEVATIATSVWGYTERGENWVGQGGVTPIRHQMIDELFDNSSDALLLFMFLKRWHWHRETFVMAKQLATSIRWGLPRFKNARKKLEELGLIQCLSPGGKGPRDPPLYTWSRVTDQYLNNN